MIQCLVNFSESLKINKWFWETEAVWTLWLINFSKWKKVSLIVTDDEALAKNRGFYLPIGLKLANEQVVYIATVLKKIVHDAIKHLGLRAANIIQQ